VDDIRWFAPNRYCTLPVPRLRAAGLRISLDGNASARLAVAAENQCVVAAYEYSRRHRCPLVVNVADIPPWRLEGGKPDFVFDLAGRIRRIPRLLGRYPERPGYYSRIRFGASRAAQVWCPSSNSVREVQRLFGIAAERVPFCYDSDRFDDVTGERSAVSGNPPVLLSISRLVPHKNHAAILRATAQLERRPTIRIIGQGPEAAPLRRLAAALDLRLDLVERWATDEEIVAAYRGATLVVAPSRFEGFGLTPMEGLAMGLPVIASDIPAHREFVGGAVRFFQLDDDAALAREIAAAAEQPRNDAPVLPSARPPVLEDLTIEAYARRLLSRLEHLLGRAR
jgi:glycosyltransferase involved in cell wall biosynthesis